MCVFEALCIFKGGGDALLTDHYATGLIATSDVHVERDYWPFVRVGGCVPVCVCVWCVCICRPSICVSISKCVCIRVSICISMWI